MTEHRFAQTFVGGIMLTIAGFLLLTANYHAQRQQGWRYTASTAGAALCYLFVSWLLSGGLT